MINGQRAHTVWIRWTKEQSTSQVGQSEVAQDFILLLRSACNLKRRNCLFLEFLFHTFRLWLAEDNYSHRKRNRGKAGTTALLPINLGRAGPGLPGSLSPLWSGFHSSGTHGTFGQREFKEQLTRSASSSGLTWDLDSALSL